MTDLNTVGQQVSEGPSAPRLTLADIESKIVKTHFHIVPETTTTICTLVLANGFTVVGKSACVSPENFDKAIGEDIARNDAVEKVWELEGYLLKEREFERGASPQERVTKERAEVATRLRDLTALLNRPERPKYISAVQWALLHGQHKAMALYVKILDKRLELFARGE